MRKNNKFLETILGWFDDMLAAVVIVVIVFSLLFKVVSVDGISMLPNFTHGDKLIINCINFDYEQGDVIVVNEVLDAPIIKRIIATENQVVDIDDTTGTVYIDGVALDESQYGIENGITKQVIFSDLATEFPLTVPENYVFVLGDNRPSSQDSRYVSVGVIDERNIMGKVILRFFPFDKFGGI